VNTAPFGEIFQDFLQPRSLTAVVDRAVSCSMLL